MTGLMRGAATVAVVNFEGRPTLRVTSRVAVARKGIDAENVEHIVLEPAQGLGLAADLRDLCRAEITGALAGKKSP